MIIQYDSELLQSTGSVSMETKQMRAMAYEVFETLNDLNPNFMNEMFYYTPNLTLRKRNLYVHSRDTVKFGNRD